MMSLKPSSDRSGKASRTNRRKQRSDSRARGSKLGTQEFRGEQSRNLTLRNHNLPGQETEGQRGTSKKVTTTVSVLGWVLSALAAVSLTLGVWLAWAEFVVLGGFLLIVVVGSVVFTIGRSSYAVDLDLAHNRIKVGERAFGQITITNVGRRGLLPARIELPVGRSRAEFLLPRLGRGQVHEEIFAIPTQHRALIGVGPVSSVRSDPLGLVRRELVWTEKHDLFVYPEIIQLGSSTAGLVKDLEGQTRNRVTDNDMNFHALREYVPGDDHRNIHWKSSARTQHLMVRQFEDTRRTFTAIGFENMTSAWSSDQEYELGVSVLASLGVQVAREEMDLAAFCAEQPLRTATSRMFLDDICQITADPVGQPYESPAQVIAKRSADASLGIIITGSITSTETLRTLSQALSPNMRVVFISCELRAPVIARSSGQLTLATLGALGDLPKLLRKVVVSA